MLQLNEKWRVNTEDPIQWILERRDGKPGQKSTGWKGNSWCVTRDALLRNIRERCGQVDADAVKTIEGWPPTRRSRTV